MVKLSTVDISIFIGYFILLIIIGFWSGRKRKADSKDFFLSEGKLPWYVIGFSIVGAGVSSEQFLGNVGFAYSHGLPVVNWEWSNAPALIILVLIFIPFYIRKKIITMPQFLERRYDSKVRTLFAIITIGTYVGINLAGVIFSGGFALYKIFGVNLYGSIIIMTVLAGAFTIYGGMASMAWTNVFQAILLLGGGLLVFFLGLAKVEGGPNGFLGEGARGHLILPASDPDIPWTGLIVLMLSTNIWYYCTNQYINQTALGAKNEWHAQVGVIFAGFLWILVALADTFPGMIAFYLNPNLGNDEAYTYVVNALVPSGLRGIVFAGLCGAILSTIESLTNAASTIFTIDIYGRVMDPDANERKLIKVGRISSAIVLTIGASCSLLVQNFEHIFSFFQECYAFIGIPVAVIFVAGVFIPKVSSKAALYILFIAFPMFIVPYLLRFYEVDMNVFNVAGIMLGVVILIAFVLTSLFPASKDESQEYIWKPSMINLKSEKQYPWYGRVSYLIILMLVVYIALYIKFW